MFWGFFCQCCRSARSRPVLKHRNPVGISVQPGRRGSRLSLGKVVFSMVGQKTRLAALEDWVQAFPALDSGKHLETM